MSTGVVTPDIRPSAADDLGPPRSAIPFERLVRVEWFKTVDTRASRWLLAVIALITVGMMLAPVLAKNDFDQNGNDYLSFAAFAVSLLLPVVAVLIMTSEWSQRTVLTTFTQEPRRARVIVAKVGAAGVLSVLALVFAAVVAATALVVSAGLSRDVSWSLSPSVGIGAVLGVVLNVAMGLGFGVLLQNSATAIVAIFALPTAFALLAAPLNKAGEWFDPSHMIDWVTSGYWDGHLMKIIVAFLLWIVLPLGAGVLRTLRREIT